MAIGPKLKKYITPTHVFFTLALITACFAFPLPVQAGNAQHIDTEKAPNKATNLFILFVLLGFMSLNAQTSPPRS